MNTSMTISQIKDGMLDKTLSYIYGEANLAYQKQRYIEAINEFEKLYGNREISLFSVAGRSELSGNHTDHNHGCVIAASIDLDIIAVAAKRDDSMICVKSEGFPED
ncbi:MAG: galactokinase family protein, partial [Clostridia bacterium]|nr:galactokinase family protein [Clostridia bacterium]